jgi:hypothetical protein
MKIFLYIVTASFMLTAISCKKDKFKDATIITDCTGTYLRSEGKDY